MKRVSAVDIDALLPQTQCGLCGFNGCMPYADALAEKKAAINLCPPGGVKGLVALGQLLGEDPSPFLVAMEKSAKPKQVAVIREAECIGCTKCLPVCPVDAIVGSAKLMHTVIMDACTGCELCILPCPVDCIDMVDRDEYSEAIEREKAGVARVRYLAHQERMARDKLDRVAERNATVTDNSIDDRKAFIQAAILRAQSKKLA